MVVALTHVISPRMNECVRTHARYELIDLDRARKQHTAYREALTRAGAKVFVLDANQGLPDCVFIEDTAIVLDEVAVMATMGSPSRRTEPDGVAPALQRYREIVRIELPAMIDGGDVLVVPGSKTILVGRSARTDAPGIEGLAALVRRFGYEVITVDVRAGCLHLKTAMTALPDRALLVNTAWIDREDLSHARHEVIPVPKEEASAANVVLIGDRVVMSSAYPRTADLVRRRGFHVDVVDLSEFAKGDGCGTCLSLVFNA